ncbi:hypothetical protein SeMB42_g05423 [Synchytrium endobioticum]|uniref:Superoxide dismutase copper/zinc binding domain-containing protein n=1 Tax=Synchytrium endobioticum TaxID=286115 RepID=A0A507CRG5_9FUNG|nr:hypothetical protein SeMB42_g05423 [Synchytrium endobioticum]TPX44848.1 hypothetical protein SeLEV6574_g04254 [Synchytrium endobioticum]
MHAIITAPALIPLLSSLLISAVRGSSPPVPGDPHDVWVYFNGSHQQNHGINGVVMFSQSAFGANSATRVTVNLTSPQPSQRYLYHVHEWAVPGGNCRGTGDHWNPYSVNYTTDGKCDPADETTCQAGDLCGKMGTMIPDSTGRFVATRLDNTLQVESILGRSITVHLDDAARTPIACATIGSKHIYPPTYSPAASKALRPNSNPPAPISPSPSPSPSPAPSPPASLPSVVQGVTVSFDPLQMQNSLSVGGSILLLHPSGNHANIHVALTGLVPALGDTAFTWHIGEFAVKNLDCTTTGRIYNPRNINTRSTPCHTGDTENFNTTCPMGAMSNKGGDLQAPDGTALQSFRDPSFDLNLAQGRSVVVSSSKNRTNIVACANIGTANLIYAP